MPLITKVQESLRTSLKNLLTETIPSKGLNFLDAFEHETQHGMREFSFEVEDEEGDIAKYVISLSFGGYLDKPTV